MTPIQRIFEHLVNSDLVFKRQVFLNIVQLRIQIFSILLNVKLQETNVFINEFEAIVKLSDVSFGLLNLVNLTS